MIFILFSMVTGTCRMMDQNRQEHACRSATCPRGGDEAAGRRRRDGDELGRVVGLKKRRRRGEQEKDSSADGTGVLLFTGSQKAQRESTSPLLRGPLLHFFFPRKHGPPPPGQIS